MSAHMRRGDFAIVGWVMEKTLEGHFQRVQEHLDVGRGILEQIAMPETNISEVVLDSEASQLALPLEGDPLVCLWCSHACHADRV
jgi:hypothetical protein